MGRETSWICPDVGVNGRSSVDFVMLNAAAVALAKKTTGSRACFSLARLVSVHDTCVQHQFSHKSNKASSH
jgi:hypothetical protein